VGTDENESDEDDGSREAESGWDGGGGGKCKE